MVFFEFSFLRKAILVFFRIFLAFQHTIRVNSMKHRLEIMEFGHLLYLCHQSTILYVNQTPSIISTTDSRVIDVEQSQS